MAQPLLLLEVLLLLVVAHGLAGGFGTPKKPQKPRSPSTKRLKKPKAVRQVHQQQVANVAVSPTRPAKKPRSAEDRERHMSTIRQAVSRHGPALCAALNMRGWGYIDDFLPGDAVCAMRAEAEGMLARNELKASESTRWDERAGKVVRYKKKNVLYTNIEGGSRYESVPMLTEYCVAMVSSLPNMCNELVFAGSQTLRSDVHTNKLAVCLGDGSKYDKHYDNMGGGDLRKLTVLLYLQDTWDASRGGCFRIHQSAARAGGQDDEVSASSFIDVEPLGGRLLCFWSDKLVHSVCESYASGGAAEHRWALTIWVHAAQQEDIHFDGEAEERHFGGGGEGQA